MAQWPGQQISPPATGQGRSGGPNVRVLVPPSSGPPTAARPDQARGEAAQATNQEYEARTRPERDRRDRERTERNDRFTQTEQVLSSWRSDPIVRQFQDARSAYIGLRNLQRDPNGVNAVATIFAFMKAIDPGSTVREGEFATAQNSGGIPTSIANAYNAALSGDGLSADQRRQMVEAAADGLEARARSYNEATFRARERLRGTGVPLNELITQLPFSGARGARGAELENRQREAFGVRERVPDPEAIRRGEGATVNAYNPQTGQWRYGIREGELPPGYEVQFGMDELDPSRIIANATGTPADASADLPFTEADLAAMESWLRAQGRNATVEGFNAFVATLPGNPRWTGPRGVGNAAEIVERWNRDGVMFRGQRPYAPPDISDMRGEGGFMEGLDATVRGGADTASFGLADEFSAGLDTLFGGGSYADNLRRQRAVDRYDEENHPVLRIGGQLAGAVAFPTGVQRVGRETARAALRQGVGRTEAVQLARAAMGRRLAIEGGAYGGAYGIGSGEGDILDRAAHGVTDAVFSAAAGRLLPEVGALDRAGGVPRAPARAQPELPPLVDEATGRLNQPLESASPAQRVAAAQEFGIDLPLDAATDRSGRIIARGLDNLPGSAGVMNDARRAVEQQVSDAAEGLASRYGSARGMYEEGQHGQRGARDWIRRATGERGTPNRGTVGRAYDAIPIPPGYPSVLENTRAALSEMTDIFRSNPMLRQRFQNSQLLHYLDALTPSHNVADEFADTDRLGGVLRTLQRGTTQEGGQLSWRDLNHFRSIIGEEIGEVRFSDSPLKSQLRRLYGALSEDMRATASAHSPDALRRFERANNLNHQVETRIEEDLVGLLGDDARRNPERAAEAINRLIRSGRGSANIQQLSNIRASTVKNGNWSEISSALIRGMGQPVGSEGRSFDPAVFVRNYSDMTPEARNLLFGSVRNGRGAANPLRSALDDFVAVNQRLAESNALRNTSNTVPAGIGAAAVGSVGTAVATGFINPLLALKMGAVGAGSAYVVNRISRVWTDPRFVRWATGYTRMLERAARSGEAPSDEAITSQRAWLLRVARSSPAIAAEIQEVADQLLPEATPQVAPSEERQR